MVSMSKHYCDDCLPIKAFNAVRPILNSIDAFYNRPTSAPSHFACVTMQKKWPFALNLSFLASAVVLLAYYYILSILLLLRRYILHKLMHTCVLTLAPSVRSPLSGNTRTKLFGTRSTRGVLRPSHGGAEEKCC